MPKEVWWDNPKTVATLILPDANDSSIPDTRRWPAITSSIPASACRLAATRSPTPRAPSRPCKAVRHPGPSRGGPRGVEPIFRDRCETERERTVQSLFGPFLIRTGSPRNKPQRRPSRTSVRSLRDPSRRRGGQVSDRRFRPQSVQRPPAVRVPDGDGQGLCRPGRDRRAGQVVATHERSLEKPTMILDPLHYLASLGRKPGALDHAPVFRDWKLPACFAEFRPAGAAARPRGRHPAVRAGLATAGRASADACPRGRRDLLA